MVPEAVSPTIPARTVGRFVILEGVLGAFAHSETDGAGSPDS
ncbi:MAG TPA: hypothetical protein VN848_12250 [Gemmatimonadales bacterium]|nr:hypothetical protein [Gemmatimonadales bacterium]